MSQTSGHYCVVLFFYMLAVYSCLCFTGGTADTGHVQIVNHSNRMLTFELSWPGHCLTITPQHGVIEPE